jgi:1-phosphatidylinositol phosphodiesterase
MQGNHMNNFNQNKLPDLFHDPEYFTLSRWMSETPSVDKLSFANLILPGAHNAGVDKKASYVAPGVSHWASCQNNSFYYQLTQGARALDLRLEYETSRNGVPTFWFQHNGFRSSRSLENLVTGIIRFVQENPDEFILLDFHELTSEQQPFDFKEFNRFLLTHLGDRMIPCRNAFLTLGQLKQASYAQRVLVAAERHPDLDSAWFCGQIDHKWSGIATTSVSELHTHITRVMKHPPRGLPWSLSATSYSGLGGPVNIKEQLDDWFDSAVRDWILKSSIVNADFFETSRLVQHCRMANIIKANNNV